MMMTVSVLIQNHPLIKLPIAFACIEMMIIMLTIGNTESSDAAELIYSCFRLVEIINSLYRIVRMNSCISLTLAHNASRCDGYRFISCRLHSRSRRADDSLALDSRCVAFVAVMNTNAQWVHTLRELCAVLITGNIIQ